MGGGDTNVILLWFRWPNEVMNPGTPIPDWYRSNQIDLALRTFGSIVHFWPEMFVFLDFREQEEWLGESWGNEQKYSLAKHLWSSLNVCCKKQRSCDFQWHFQWQIQSASFFSRPIPAHPPDAVRDGLAGKKQNLNGDSGDSAVSSDTRDSLVMKHGWQIRELTGHLDRKSMGKHLFSNGDFPAMFDDGRLSKKQ